MEPISRGSKQMGFVISLLTETVISRKRIAFM